MPRFIQYGFVVLASLLPIQNVIINLIVNRIGWPDWLGLWKEAVVAVIVAFFLWQIWQKIHETKYQFEWNKKWPLAAITLATILITLSSFWWGGIEVGEFIVGFRFELWWVWFFATTVTWWQVVGQEQNLESFKTLFQKSIYFGFALTAIVALASTFFGQPVVTSLWNSTNPESTAIIAEAPDCHVVDYQVAGCRVAGAFSTPNHFVGYLLLILPIFIINFLQWLKEKHRAWNWRSIFDLYAIFLISIFTFLSISRYAWLGLAIFAGFGLILGAVKVLPEKPWVSWVAKIDFFSVLLIPLFISTIAVNLSSETIRQLPLPETLVKPSSTTLHAKHTNSALQIIRENPDKLLTGWGLPSAGPGAKEQFVSQYKNEMIEENRLVAYQNGLLPANLAIPENWFLQLIQNGGLLYFFLYTSILLIPIYHLFRVIWRFDVSKPKPYAILFFGVGFFSVILGNLLLHIWENQTIAIYWTMVWLIWQTNFNLLAK